MSKVKKRYVRKFGKAGKFDAFDGKPEKEDFLECFIEKTAYDKSIEALKNCYEETARLNHIMGDNGIFEEKEGQALNMASEIEDRLQKTLKELGEIE